MKILKNIISLFYDNWWLKLIALLLAIVVYHGTRTELNNNQNKSTNDRPIFRQFK